MKLSAYARVSSDEQAERGTIENQIEFGEKYAILHQLGPIKWPDIPATRGTLA